MFGLTGINSTLDLILKRIKELRQKLDIMSGVDNNTEGITKRILLIDKEILEKTNQIFGILNSGIEDQSDFFFSQVQIDNIIIEGRVEKITMNEFQQVSATYSAQKKDGSPAKVENPRLETDHPELVEATLDAEASRITIRPKKGVLQEDTAIAVKLLADADLGEGERDIEIVGSLMLTVGEAEKLELKFDDPVDLEETPTPTPTE